MTTILPTVRMTVLGDSETVRLYGWVTEWADAASPVRALLFGQMVRRAIPVVEQYHSDLFHDAQWVAANVNGACEFLWMVRMCGTNIANSAEVQERISSREPRVLYHVALTMDASGCWWVTFSELVRVEVEEPTV